MIQDLMVREFGCVPKEEDLSQCLWYIESKKFLVLTLERLSESLVLLKRRLCWKFKDVVCAFARKKNYLKSSTWALMEKYEEFSPLDHQLYRYFATILGRQKRMGFKRKLLFWIGVLSELRISVMISALEWEALHLV